MKKQFLFLLIILFTLDFAHGQTKKYRWDVKLLVDTAGHRVYKMKADAATIKELAGNTSNPRPADKERQKGKRAD